MGDQARAAKAAIYKMRAPPRMPHTYMSRAYPIYEDKKNLADDTDRAPVYMQFRLVQQEEQRQDLARILCNKDVKYMEFRLKNQHLSNYCEICSEFPQRRSGKMQVVRHRHFATSVENSVRQVDEFGRITCSSCVGSFNTHLYKQAARISLVLSSSTLHHCLTDADLNFGYRGNPIHLDWSTIPGGKINGALHGYRALYSGSNRPVDCLAVLGVNDVANGHSAERIYHDILRLKEAVLETCPRHHTGPSSFAIATPLWPPALSRLTYAPSHHEPEQDRTATLLKVTEDIIQLNNNTNQKVWETCRAPKFHRYGLVTREAIDGDKVQSSVLDRIPYKHRYGDWREPDINNMIHLNDRRRLAMGTACVRYFKEIYGIKYEENHFR